MNARRNLIDDVQLLAGGNPIDIVIINRERAQVRVEIKGSPGQLGRRGEIQPSRWVGRRAGFANGSGSLRDRPKHRQENPGPAGQKNANAVPAMKFSLQDYLFPVAQKKKQSSARGRLNHFINKMSGRLKATNLQLTLSYISKDGGG